jgi:hypothetical protein
VKLREAYVCFEVAAVEQLSTMYMLAYVKPP